jgi:hypothetical protein
MPTEANFEKNREARVKAYEILRQKSKNLGEIMRNHPRFQSNSPELYLLAYLKELGSAEI